MELLGRVLHISKSKRLVIQSEYRVKIPKPGRKVLTKDEKVVGKIAELFGPINKPYITVKPNKNTKTEKLVGKCLYIG